MEGQGRGIVFVLQPGNTDSDILNPTIQWGLSYGITEIHTERVSLLQDGGYLSVCKISISSNQIFRGIELSCWFKSSACNLLNHHSGRPFIAAFYSLFTKMAKRKITVQGAEISLITQHDDDYISLTDMARKFNEVPNDVIKAWMRNSANVEFLGTWEIFHNPDFKTVAYNRFRFESSSNAFFLTVKQWVQETSAIGIHATAGRYGGTYAHRDIAVQFATWLSPTFYLYVIKEFQRLKEEENERANLGWDLKRQLAKVNYYLHTEAVRQNLVPVIDWNTRREAIYMASEADLLNMALFGMTAKEWRLQYPEAKGNIRDQASPEQLVTLSNLEVLNANYIEEGLAKDERLRRLNQKAADIMQLLSAIPAMDVIKRLR